MAQHFDNNSIKQVRTDKFDREEIRSRIIMGAGLEEDSNDSEAGSDDDVPKVQHLPDQVWEYPLTRKDQHRRFAKMQDLANEDMEARIAQLKMEKLRIDRELRCTQAELDTKEGALKDIVPRYEMLQQQDRQKKEVVNRALEIMEQALKIHPHLDEEARTEWAAIRQIGCPGARKADNLQKKNRASSSTASTRASTCTRASTSDDAHPEQADDVEEEAEDYQFAEFMQRSRALLDNLDRQPQPDAAARAPAAAAGPAAAGPAAAGPAAAGPPAAPQQQQAPLAIADYPSIWSRTKGVLVDLFQPFETELPPVVDEDE